MPPYNDSLIKRDFGVTPQPSLSNPNLRNLGLTRYPSPGEETDEGGAPKRFPGGPVVDLPWEHKDVFNLIDPVRWTSPIDDKVRRKKSPIEEFVPPINQVAQILPLAEFQEAPEELRQPVSEATLLPPSERVERMPTPETTLSAIDFSAIPEVPVSRTEPGDDNGFVTTTGGIAPDQDRSRDLADYDFDTRPSNELEDLIGGAYEKLVSGENPVYEKNRRMAMTQLARQERVVEAELSRQAAQMGVRPGTKEYNELREKLKEGLYSSGSSVMANLAAQNLAGTQSALAGASQFMGQQQRYGMDYGKFTYQRMKEDRAYAENMRRWDTDWEENNRRWGQERADELTAQKIANLQKTMGYVDYLSPGQFGEVKGELAELLGVGGEAWDAPDKRQIDYMLDELMDRGYTREEAEAELNEAKKKGYLSLFGGIDELRDASGSVAVDNSGGSAHSVSPNTGSNAFIAPDSDDILNLVDPLGGGYKSGGYGSVYGQGGVGLL